MKKMDTETLTKIRELEEVIEAQGIRDIGELVKHLRTAGMEEHLKLVYKHRAHFSSLFNSKQYKKPRVSY